MAHSYWPDPLPFKDQAVAAQLGIGHATVERRIRRLMDLTGADSRFQLATEAITRGWLRPD